jgi:hypothetical protein
MIAMTFLLAPILEPTTDSSTVLGLRYVINKIRTLEQMIVDVSSKILM